MSSLTGQDPAAAADGREGAPGRDRHSPALVLLAWFSARLLVAVVYASLSFRGRSLAWGDLALYEFWAGEIASTGAMPDGVTWMYPPLTAPYLVLVDVWPAAFGPTFVVSMLLADLAVLALLLRARRDGAHGAGAWAWVVLVPLLGLIGWARLDMLPVAAAAAALLLAARHPVLAGVVAALGTAIKGWPVVLGLLFLRDRRWLAGAMTTGLAVALALTLFLEDTWAFVANLGGRGTQIESVTALPWMVQQAFGATIEGDFVNGSYEVLEPGAAAMADLAKLLMVLAVGGAVWWSRHRAPALRWYTAVTALLATSPLLSTQFVLWLIGGVVVAASLPGPDGRIARRTLPVVTAIVVITHLTFPVQWSGLVDDGVLAAWSLVVRNGLLLALTVWLLLAVRGGAEDATIPAAPSAHQRETVSPASNDASR